MLCKMLLGFHLHFKIFYNSRWFDTVVAAKAITVIQDSCSAAISVGWGGGGVVSTERAWNR